VDVLVIDIGGSHVKLRVSSTKEKRRFDSGPQLTPQALVDGVHDAAGDWHYNVISIGYPGAVHARGPRAEPRKLADGWVGFNFSEAFGKPVRIVNDAVMQALGAYDDGRMLFLGLGTGLGSALITEHVVVPLELGDLPYGDGATMADHLGRSGLEAHGRDAWVKDVGEATIVLRDALAADYVVLGGGNADQVEPLPPGARRGGNEDAFTGGVRLWEEMVEPHDPRPPRVWRVVR
jgi:polyphosphate glucokinase